MPCARMGGDHPTKNDIGKLDPCRAAGFRMIRPMPGARVYPPLQQHLVFFGKVAFTLGKLVTPPLLALLHEHLGTGCIQEDAPSKVNASPEIFKKNHGPRAELLRFPCFFLPFLPKPECCFFVMVMCTGGDTGIPPMWWSACRCWALGGGGARHGANQCWDGVFLRPAWGESSLAWGPRADAFCTCPQYHTHAVGKGSKGAIFSLVSIPQAGPIPDVTNRYGLIS